MAASNVSGMKMRTLLFGLILGLLAVVHSTPVNDVSEVPAKALDEVLREAVTDGFLVENLAHPSGTTGSPATGSPATDSPMEQTTGLPATDSPMEQTTGLPATDSPMEQTTGLPATDSPMEQTTGLPATDSPMEQTTGLPATDSPMKQATGLPATNSTIQASQRPFADFIEGVAIEGSGGEAIEEATTSVSLHFETTTVSHASSAASTLPPRDDSSSVSAATQSPLSGSAPVPNETQPSATPDHISASQTTDPAVSTFGFPSTQGSFPGSGDGEMFGLYSTTSTHSSMTFSAETSTASSTSATKQTVPVPIPGSEGSGSEEGLEVMPTTTAIKNGRQMFIETNNGKIYESVPESSTAGGTPGWMIIVGFIVGLAALVMLFVAIATRERWNGPSRASQLEDKTNASIQHREVEMETFLPNDRPKENGRRAEYTVIPLEELPEKYSSH
ncbi:polycystic kidney disease protein 1-like 3 [Cyclopterus lumpus]|uniref:polycystic kidney disease protein 1-like 3 n=1 Tax=Cyclopterus lumpus TaxID=8103 RepID=UPI001485D556|nr:polycystic kidney disease protein 1-like 3 [Cyclopterus lumpus]